MGIFLKQNYDTQPLGWGSTQDVQYAIQKNSEKIYGVNPDNNVLSMPMFWGLPPYNYSRKIQGAHHGVTYKEDKFKLNGNAWIIFDLNTELKIQGEITISARIRLNSDYTSSQSVIGDAHTTGATANYGLNFGYVDNKFDFWNNASGSSIISNTSISDNNVRNVAITRAGILGNWTLKFYINGILDKTQAGVAADPNGITTYAAISQFGGYPGYRWNGFMYDVRVSTDVYTPEQIARFNDRPYDLYKPVSKPFYLLPIAPIGWTGKINTVINPSKIMGVSVEDISKVNGIEGAV